MKRVTRTAIYVLLLLVSINARGISQTAENTSNQLKPMSTGQILQQTVVFLAKEIRSSVSGGKFSRVAVMPFTTLHGEENDLGLYISAKLTSELSVGEDNLQLVERSQINQALAEMHLGETGFLSEETIQSTGRALGADAIIVGMIVEIGSEIDINLRVFSVSTLKILGKASQLISTNEVIESMLSTSESLRDGMDDQSPPPYKPYVPKGDTLFYDDFERSEELGVWQSVSGEWLMVDGTIAQNSNSRSAFVVAGQDDWRNYILEARVKGIDGGGPYIGVRLDEQTGNCVVWDVSDGGWMSPETRIRIINIETAAYRNLPQKKRFAFVMAAWYDVKVEVRGGTIICYLDGEEMLNLTDPEIAKLRHGKIVLGTSGSRTYFDEVRVTRIE